MGQTGNPAMRDPHLRRARALMMAERKIKNTSLADIAKEFNVTVDTVSNELRYLRTLDLFESFEDRIMNELIPTAIDTFKLAMQNGDVDVATKVFKGMGMLLKPSEKVIAQQQTRDDELETYVRQIGGGSVNGTSRSNRNRPGLPSGALASAGAPSALSGSVVEGAVIRAEDAPQELGADGRESGAQDADGLVELPDHAS